MGVSSGETITGVSQKIKESFPNSKVIATDIVGSVIFGGTLKKRYIPGIGSGMVPKIIKYAKIDDVVMVDKLSIGGIMLYLSENNLKEIALNWENTIEAIDYATKCLHERNFAQPIKPYLRYRDLKNRIIAMPAFVGEI